MEQWFFNGEDTRALMRDKFMVIIGDSIQRSIYKDLVVLWSRNRLIMDKELRAKGEPSFCGDMLIDKSEPTNGFGHREVREFKTNLVRIRFYFATRIYSDYIEAVLKEFEDGTLPPPDVVLINSCLWDINKALAGILTNFIFYSSHENRSIFGSLLIGLLVRRNGRTGFSDYLNNLERFCCRLDKAVPPHTLKIWRTTLPVRSYARGGFLGHKASDPSLSHQVPWANHLSCSVVAGHRYDIIDFFRVFIHQLQWQMDDGVHWNTVAHRQMTNIILNHISTLWCNDLSPPFQFFQNHYFQETQVLPRWMPRQSGRYIEYPEDRWNFTENNFDDLQFF